MPRVGAGSADSDGYAASTPEASCNFSPFGEQTQANLETLGTQKLCKIPLLRVSHSVAASNILFILSLIDTAVVALLIAQFLPESSAHVFNAGASVWGLDWCPVHPDDDRVRTCSFPMGPH